MNEKIAEALRSLQLKKPLTHVITHQIAANDTANCILALGARPIMSEHPAEMAEVVSAAASLGVSLGNINESRLRAIKLAGTAAKTCGKPQIIDCVGVAISRLRMDFAREYIAAYNPSVVKGNASELLALVNCRSHAIGVDAGAKDALFHQVDDGRTDTIELLALKDFSEKAGTIIVITGEKDIVIDGRNVALVSNGTPLLGKITGSGCMLTGVIAAFMGAGVEPMTAALAGLTAFSVAGERAAAKAGCNHPGTFHALLFDKLAELSEENLTAKIKIL